MININWLKNKHIIITGVSSGIGRELARQLVKEFDCDILGVARNTVKLDAIKKELNNNFCYYSMDVGDPVAWNEFAKSALMYEFQPDIIINNAGIIHPFESFMALSDEEIKRVVSTNYLSLIYSCRVMIPILSNSTTPSIINVSSASALLPVAGASVYSSTKSAAYSLTDVIREEFMGRGYYVAVVLPGPVKTGLYDVKDENGEGKEKVADKDLFKNVGITAERAANIILQKMCRKKSYIIIGGTARTMSYFHKILPNTSIKITGKMLRVLPIKTFKGIFEEEKRIKSEIKTNKKS